LTLVASLVRAHGGRVEHADAAGGGAVFTVRLPIA
jgi:signal transduction histidine kinase